MDSTALPRRSFSWLRSSSSSALQRVVRGRDELQAFPWWECGLPAKIEKRWEKMYSLKTFFVCVKPCTVYSVHGKWGSPKDQPEIAGDLPEMRPFLVQQMYRKILWFIIIIFPIRIARYFQIVWGYPHFRYTQQMMGIACGPAVPDACIRCNFDSDAPISRESLLKGPNDSVSRLGGINYDLVADKVWSNTRVVLIPTSQWPKSAVIPSETVGRTGFPWDYDNPQLVVQPPIIVKCLKPTSKELTKNRKPMKKNSNHFLKKKQRKQTTILKKQQNKKKQTFMRFFFSPFSLFVSPVFRFFFLCLLVFFVLFLSQVTWWPGPPKM